MIALIGLLYQFIQLLPPYRSGLPSFPSDVGAAERAALEASIVPSSTDGWFSRQVKGMSNRRRSPSPLRSGCGFEPTDTRIYSPLL